MLGKEAAGEKKKERKRERQREKHSQVKGRISYKNLKHKVIGKEGVRETNRIKESQYILGRKINDKRKGRQRVFLMKQVDVPILQTITSLTQIMGPIIAISRRREHMQAA